MQHPTYHIFDQTPESLEAWCLERGMPKFRAKQILEWVYEKGIADPAQMSNLSKLDRTILAEQMTFLSGQTIRHQLATDGTQKLLIQWDDGEEGRGPRDEGRGDGDDSSTSPLPSRTLLPVLSSSALGPQPSALDSTRQTECVMIPSEDRRTACISSQVGCPVGCRFCASGLGGLDANLSAGRIVEQVWRLRFSLPSAEEIAQESSATGGDASKHAARRAVPPQAIPPQAVPPSTLPPRISNVVFMGMGEPLANLSNVVPAVRTLNAHWGPNISARKITISTVGLPKAIERLAEELDLPVTLALSLHAPNDQIRRELIPWAKFTTIADLLSACRKWFEKTGREITLEYTLLRGINDRPEHAVELSQVAKTLRANINLIRYNEVEGLPFKRPLTEDVLEFQRLLRAREVNAHIRASRGRDIAAACGQLRHESAKAAASGAGASGDAA
jgi:23S rRNA (adenine2503-C2)-methyltransferase